MVGRAGPVPARHDTGATPWWYSIFVVLLVKLDTLEAFRQ